MTKSGKFIKFLDTLQTSENAKLLESVKQGFRAVVENYGETWSGEDLRTFSRNLDKFEDYMEKEDPSYNRNSYMKTKDININTQEGSNAFRKKYFEWKEKNGISNPNDADIVKNKKFLE